ncbi:MAG TPA: carboxypeptidase regulatory-like domain-containing protein [Terriglobales bacterium]|jgi:hypothetical protein|nr:carboxypeptidase regulatory-like domain-containing protein [Terriglobales bacterium]
MLPARRFFSWTLLASVLVLIFSAQLVLAQTTISTGSLQGTIVDPSGAVVSGAKVIISSKQTGQAINTTTNSAGVYASGALTPGDYVVRVEAKGFKTAELPVTVQVGVTAPGSIRLQVGQADQVVEVEGTALQVNTEQATVQGVLSAQQIDTLPINGRNFLDLAQLEPGVQIQDGGTFDPTKNGFSSISFGGRYGRTARIEVDGIDISDETVGTTTQNIPAGAISEFQIGQSMLDLSTELTSSGSVNVVTRSGTNTWHGDAFYLFRDSSLAAKLPGTTSSPFQRNQFGGRFGGPVIKDRLFFFLTGERIKQDLSAPVQPSEPFGSLAGNYSSPFRDAQLMGRLDYQLKGSARLFYRFSYEQNRNVSGYIPNTYQPFANVNHTPVHAGGIDFTTGAYTHSIRAGYTKFRNGITDATIGTSIINPAPQLELSIGSDPFCLTPAANSFCSGPNFLAPQSTFQTDKQVKYDGSRTWGNHVLRYGVGYNRLLGGGLAEFLALAPAVSGLNVVSGGNSINPLDYAAEQVILANGIGFSSEKAAFGQPGGRLGPDNRLALYVGDSWKIRKNLTLTYGLRWVRDTGRTDSDLAPNPCSQLDPGIADFLAANNNPCTGNILDLWGAGLGKPVRQPNTNFAPQFGLAWDPTHSGRTVIRAGAGLFYENSVWNNNLYDRPARLPQGLFLGFQTACENGSPVSFSLPGQTDVITPTFCGDRIGDVANDIAALQQQYQAATLTAGPAVNGVFIGNILSASNSGTSTNMFAPDYRTARSVQMNLGFQHEFGKGIVWTADFVRNVGTRNLLAVDVNHVGDASHLDTPAALDAITATLEQNAPSCVPGVPMTAGSISQAAIQCYLATFNPANISDFAANGLDSADSFCGGLPCWLNGQPDAAFPGKNKFLGTNQMLFPVGRSIYNALQTSLKTHLGTPFRGAQGLDMQVSYSFSRYEATAQDSDFINSPEDANSPTHFRGPNGLDRTHQISFGGTLDLPRSFRVSFISHFYSPLPLDLRLPTTGAAGGIFVSDITGDGTGDGTAVSNGNGFGDLLPGTKLGAYGRTVSPQGLSKIITAYNQQLAGTPTPAGQALINAGILTKAQLSDLGGVLQPLNVPPPGQVELAWLKTFDLRASWQLKVRERFVVEPSAALFNVFNFGNFDGANNTLSGVLDGSYGSANGTSTRVGLNTRTGFGTGVFGLGAPRALEFGLRITF